MLRNVTFGSFVNVSVSSVKFRNCVCVAATKQCLRVGGDVQKTRSDAMHECEAGSGTLPTILKHGDRDDLRDLMLSVIHHL